MRYTASRRWLWLVLILSLVLLLRPGREVLPVVVATDSPPPAAMSQALQGVAQPIQPAVVIPTVTPSPQLATPEPVVPRSPTSVMPPFTTAEPGVRPYLPILMYHYVRQVDPSNDPLGYNLSVTPEQFAAQLAWLQAQGFATIRMDTLAACIQGLAPCPARAIALTFDDGYLDAYHSVLPILRQYNAVATFYIVSDFIGRPGYMGWAELQALRDAGMELGAHSVSHPDLTMLAQAEAAAQIGESRRILREQLGVPVESFCYPAGRFNEQIVELTRAAGFTNATTTVQDGPQHDLYRLPRLRIYGDLTLEGFTWLMSAYAP
jgi:peptidoglycan/xylan/chitin deacetylase (PgdA/CDA1 family)